MQECGRWPPGLLINLGEAARPPDSGGQRDPVGSREGRFPTQSLQRRGIATSRTISTASRSCCPPKLGGRAASRKVLANLDSSACPGGAIGRLALCYGVTR